MSAGAEAKAFVASGATFGWAVILAVAHQSAGCYVFTLHKNARQPTSERKFRNPLSLGKEKSVRHKHDGVDAVFSQLYKRAL
jgi:hypothetical protein